MATQSKAATASPTSSETFSTGSAGGPVATKNYVTFAQERIDHWISDEELVQLSELRKDNVVEIFWGALGAFLGALVPALLALEKIGNEKDPVMWSDLVTMLICSVALVVTGIMGMFWWQRARASEDLVNRIRNRPKAIVQASK